MKAAVFRQYGKPSVLEIADLPAPEPGAGQALIRVKAAGINPKDAAVRAGVFRWVPGQRLPQTAGYDFAGVIEKLGPGVSAYQVGDEVYGHLDGLRGGAAAEYLVVNTKKMAPKPPSLDFAQAAAMPCTYLTALQSFRNYARLQQGSRVLIYGASGGVGTAALQIGRCLGYHVTAVSHSRNEAFCREMGADAFIPYDQAEVFAGSAEYDCFLQVFVRGGRLYREARRILRKGGVFLTLDPHPREFARSLWSHFRFGPRAYAVIVRARRQDLDWLSEKVKEGKLMPHLQETVPLAEIERAHGLIAGKHTRGKIVLIL